MILNEQKAQDILEYCRPHLDQMWAAVIVGIILGCDFRDAKFELARYDLKRADRVDEWKQVDLARL